MNRALVFGGIASLGGLLYAGRESIASRYTRDIDTSVLENQNSIYSAIKGTFGGDNLILNPVAEIGSGLLAKHVFMKQSSKMGNKIRQIDRMELRFNQSQAYFNSPTAQQQNRMNSLLSKRASLINQRKAFKGYASKSLRLGKIAAWAPVAFLAFDMVTSLSDMPAPQPTYNMRKAAGLGGTFMDSSTAYTQRKRALQAMHNSQYSGRSALGNEASLLHQ